PFEQGVPLYAVVNDEYTDAVKEHLANLGLSTDYHSAGLTWTTVPPPGEMLVFHGISETGEWVVVPESGRAAERVILAGNTPDGKWKSWTFREKVVRAVFNGSVGDSTVWFDEETGEQADADQTYLLAALCFSWYSTPVKLADPRGEPGVSLNPPANLAVSFVASQSRAPVTSGYTGQGLLSGYVQPARPGIPLRSGSPAFLQSAASGTAGSPISPQSSGYAPLTDARLLPSGPAFSPAGLSVPGTDSWKVPLPRAPAI
ncbi:MAG: hypothetical protein LUQ25_04015, partial [Methanoregulaceae archaeon]|nr:hypothetical protein [Methanoregulaceae archaeon]